MQKNIFRHGSISSEWIFFLFRKVSEPWELADGCVHLVGEIATIKVWFFSIYYPPTKKKRNLAKTGFKECEEELDKLLSAVAR